MSIRIATERDAAELLDIYRPYVEQTAITFEYEAPSEQCFREKIIQTLKNYPYLVSEDEQGRLCGYVYASLFRERPAYQWSVETSIYIKQDCRGKGYGRILYQKLEECLKYQHILNANACIAYAREDNTMLDNSSMRFHEKMGYRLVGTFHNSGYKYDQWYDMIWMEKMLGEHLKGTEKFIPFENIRGYLTEMKIV